MTWENVSIALKIQENDRIKIFKLLRLCNSANTSTVTSACSL